MRRSHSILLLALLGACAHAPRSATLGLNPKVSVMADAQPAIATDWKTVMLPADAARLATLETRWTKALAGARQSSFKNDVDGEGVLLDPQAGLSRPAPPPGRYKCRIVRIGQGASGPAFERFKPQFCFVDVEGDLLTFVKGTGTRRPGGRLWDDGNKRLIFLGAVPQGAKEALPAYGVSSDSNIVGVVERVGDFQWRMTTPGPDDGAQVEVMELVPDTQQAATPIR